MDEYRYAWNNIGSFAVVYYNLEDEKTIVEAELSRAYITDYELLNASKEVKEMEETEEVQEEAKNFDDIESGVSEANITEQHSDDDDGGDDSIQELNGAFDAIAVVEKIKKKRGPRNRKKKIQPKKTPLSTAHYESFEEYWNAAGTFLIYSTWLQDHGKNMTAAQVAELRFLITDNDPIYLIDQHEKFLENPRYMNITNDLELPTYAELYDMHCKAVEKLTMEDFEKFRIEKVSRRAKSFFTKIENLGFTPGYTKASLPRNERKPQDEKVCVFDDCCYAIDDRYAKPQRYWLAKDDDKNNAEAVPEAVESSSDTEIRFDFDPKKDAHLIASNAKKLYENDPEIRKYYFQRYRLFSKLDSGIIMDKEGWFSVTPERIAEHIADRVIGAGVSIVVDAFTGVGGNAIQFALKGAHVIAIDLDPVRLKCARQNAIVYGVEDHISFICGDFFDIAATWTSGKGPAPKVDAVFLSPPWGGPSYLDSVEFDLEHGCTPNGIEIFDAAIQLSPNIAYFLPRNTKVRQLIELSGKVKSRLEIEQSSLNSKLKTITAYYGSLAYDRKL